MLSLIRIVVVLIIAVVAWRVCTLDNEDADTTTTVRPITTSRVAPTTTTATTQAAVTLTSREKQCARDYHKTYTVPEDRMLWLKETGREGIFEWAGGHWLSYDKVMEVCDQRIAAAITTAESSSLRPSLTVEERDCARHHNPRVSAGTMRTLKQDGTSIYKEGRYLSYKQIMDTCATRSAPPANPGDSVGCADFDTWKDAQNWYDTYAPHYGDVALIDTNNNGVACEKLLPEGVTVAEVAATVTTATPSTTRQAVTTTRPAPTTTRRTQKPYSDLSHSEPQNAYEDAFLVAVAAYATGTFLLDLPLDVPLHYGRVTCLNLDDGQSVSSQFRVLSEFFGDQDGAVVLAAAVNFLCTHHELALDRWIEKNY